LAACVRRGIDALELREGDGHGIAPGDLMEAGSRILEPATAAGVDVVAYRILSPSGTLPRARQGAAVRLLVDGTSPLAHRLEQAAELEFAGAAVAVVVRDELEAGVVSDSSFDIAWDVAPGTRPAGETAQMMLQRFGPWLRHVHISGGGPESAMQEGRGIGELMGRLALHRYSAAVALAPSSPHFRVAWDNWLGRRGGWGCGSKTAEPSLVALHGAGMGGAA
ncbi:MAG TPA: hypothetical protein VK966_10115, partial [Longimicrobiales bacterium]|nr:hypothetical protein [Longimicrobiales bacterium]